MMRCLSWGKAAFGPLVEVDCDLDGPRFCQKIRGCAGKGGPCAKSSRQRLSEAPVPPSVETLPLTF